MTAPVTKPPKNKLNGWLIIDKPYDMGSTDVVRVLKRWFHPEKIGHAGTLDPKATGVLPVAFGQATKTIPYVMDGSKTYQFTVEWGRETTTDDLAGTVTETSEKRPTLAEIEAVLSDFIGDITQTPPAYSAIKINGRRAYDLARRGETVDMKSRTVHIDSLHILEYSPEKTTFEVACGKGTYVRSIGRDIGRKLGCLGTISFLRRTKCGPFSLNHTILLDFLEKQVYSVGVLDLIPVLTALDDILVLAVDENQADDLVHGRALPKNAFPETATAADGSVFTAKYGDTLVALVKCELGHIKPFRVFAGADLINK